MLQLEPERPCSFCSHFSTQETQLCSFAAQLGDSAVPPVPRHRAGRAGRGGAAVPVPRRGREGGARPAAAERRSCAATAAAATEGPQHCGCFPSGAFRYEPAHFLFSKISVLKKNTGLSDVDLSSKCFSLAAM